MKWGMSINVLIKGGFRGLYPFQVRRIHDDELLK